MITDATLRCRVGGAVSLVAVVLLISACGVDGPDAHLAGPAADAEAEQAEAATAAATEGPVEEATGEMTTAEESDGMESAGAEEGVEEAATDTVAPTGEVVTVLSLDNSFVDEVVEVAAGTEVLWTNNGRNEHNIVPVDPTQEWGVEVEDFQPGDEYAYVFGAPGEYPYFCSIHGTETVGMIGTIVVTG